MKISESNKEIWYSKDLPGIGRIELEAYNLGKGDKKKVLILGMHGDELTPYLVVSKMLEDFKINDYALKIIPVINFAGFLKGKRMEPFYEVNLNRQFGIDKKNYTVEITQSLLGYINDAEIIIDMHNWDSPTTAFGLCFDQNCCFNTGYLNTFASLGAKFIVNSSEKDIYENTLGKTIKNSNYYAIEYPMQMFLEEKQIKMYANGLLNVLNEEKLTEEPILINERHNIAGKQSGIFKSIVNPGTYVRKNQLLGYLLDPLRMFNRYDIRCENPGYILYHEKLRYILESEVLYSIGKE